MNQSLIYDRTLALQLAGQKADLAAELLQGLVTSLPETLEQIQQTQAKNDSKTLLQAIHRLRGLICYCGVPRLDAAAHALETALREACPEPTLTEKLSAFLEESEAVLALS